MDNYPKKSTVRLKNYFSSWEPLRLKYLWSVNYCRITLPPTNSSKKLTNYMNALNPMNTSWKWNSIKQLTISL
jgi:hypothetical protein